MFQAADVQALLTQGPVVKVKADDYWALRHREKQANDPAYRAYRAAVTKAWRQRQREVKEGREE